MPSDLHSFVSIKNKNRPKLLSEPLQLENGLLMRIARLEDKEKLCDFNATVHGSKSLFGSHAAMFFKEGDESHPTANWECTTLIVDKDDNIISSFMSIPQVWEFRTSGCPEKVQMIAMRPEAIGTLEEYRGQGLIKRHFDVHHKWALEMNSLVQFIGGIPLYYNRFGYLSYPEKAQGRSGYLCQIEKAIEKKTNEDIEYTFRLATLDDIEFITRVNLESDAMNRDVSSALNFECWKHFLARPPGSFGNRSVWVIEDEVSRVGFIQMQSYAPCVVVAFELDKPSQTRNASWEDVTMSLIRWFPTYYRTYYKPLSNRLQDANNASSSDPPTHELNDLDIKKDSSLPSDLQFSFELGKDHPCYKSISSSYLPQVGKPGHWYTRIPDPIEFIRKITPLLNHRLVSSGSFQCLTKQLVISSSFRSTSNGILIRIIKGKVEHVEPSNTTTWQSASKQGLVGCLPPEYWTAILIGSKTFSQLRDETSRVFGADVLFHVCDVLFPLLRNDQILGMD